MIPAGSDGDALWAETLLPSTIYSATRGGEVRLRATILYHPDLRRVGQSVSLEPLDVGRGWPISRVEPLFGEAPLGDPYLSRRCVELTVRPDEGLRIAALGDQDARVAGRSLGVGETLDVTRQQLRDGVVLQLRKRVALMLRITGVSVSTGASHGLIGGSDAMALARDEIARVAQRQMPVLVRGESGTGKELVARAIHAASTRSSGPLVSVNMAGLSPSMATSELFGHARGAFTGAVRAHQGYFAQAEGGTLFLDEIGDTPMEVQLKLLRALETGEIHPAGAAAPRRVDVRVVAATDQSLESAIASGTFRAQLYHRLAQYQIDLPPLRTRREDVSVLLRHFLESEIDAGANPFDGEHDPKAKPWLRMKLMMSLLRHPWPGNVRELRNAASQLVVASAGLPTVSVPATLERLLADPKKATSPVTGVAPGEPSRAKRVPAGISDDELLDALRSNGFGVRAAAKALGISKTSLYQLMDSRPAIRQAKDLSEAELETSWTAHDGDTQRMSDELQVSRAALRRRMTELGLGR